MPRVLPAFHASGELNQASIQEAAELLRAGRLVALPTETVYGLAADARNPDAVKRIFAAKGRPSFNPLIVHVSGIEQAKTLAANWPESAERLARAFWPGPLSLVLPRRPIIPLEVTGGLETVALRAPAHPVAQAVLAASGLPFAAPSANRSNAISPTCAAHVLTSLGDRIDAVLDGGSCAVGIESTVVDVTRARPVVLRPGGVTAEAIERVIGPLGLRDEGGTIASPGMLDRHYAPDAITRLFDPRDLASALGQVPASARIGAVVRTVAAPKDERIVAWELLGNDPVMFAREIYGALHRLEAAGVTYVLLETLPPSPEWEAVADRLRRASSVG
jgi:L-threonylcarbamoyladenylate synthase